MLLACFLLIKAEIVPKDDNKPFHTFFVNLFLLIHPEISGGRKRYEMTYFLGCYPIVLHTPTVGTIMVILYSSVIFWCSAIKDIVWGHGRMAIKLYIPSTINIRGKLIIPAIWADKNGLVSGRLACTSSETKTYTIFSPKILKYERNNP